MAINKTIKSPLGKQERVYEIEKQITEAIRVAADDNHVQGVLDMLAYLRKQGIQRSKYNLGNPYGQELRQYFTGHPKDGYV